MEERILNGIKLVDGLIKTFEEEIKNYPHKQIYSIGIEFSKLRDCIFTSYETDRFIKHFNKNYFEVFAEDDYLKQLKIYTVLRISN